MADGFFGGIGDFFSGLGSGLSDITSQLFGGGGGGGQPTGFDWNTIYPGGAATSDLVTAGQPGVSVPAGVNIPGVSSGSGGFWNSVSSGASGLGDLAKNALLGDQGQGGWLTKLAPLAGAGVGIYSNITAGNRAAEMQRLLKRSMQRQEEVSGPAAAAGSALTAAGEAAMLGGPLPPQLESQIEAFKDQLRMQYRQQLADRGMTDSSAAVQLEGWINQQAQALRAQLAAGLLQQGYAGVNSALGASRDIAQTAQGQLNTLEGNVAGASQELGRMFGRG